MCGENHQFLQEFRFPGLHIIKIRNNIDCGFFQDEAEPNNIMANNVLTILTITSQPKDG